MPPQPFGGRTNCYSLLRLSSLTYHPGYACLVIPCTVCNCLLSRAYPKYQKNLGLSETYLRTGSRSILTDGHSPRKKGRGEARREREERAEGARPIDTYSSISIGTPCGPTSGMTTMRIVSATSIPGPPSPGFLRMVSS